MFLSIYIILKKHYSINTDNSSYDEIYIEATSQFVLQYN